MPILTLSQQAGKKKKKKKDNFHFRFHSQELIYQQYGAKSTKTKILLVVAFKKCATSSCFVIKMSSPSHYCALLRGTGISCPNNRDFNVLKLEYTSLCIALVVMGATCVSNCNSIYRFQKLAYSTAVVFLVYFFILFYYNLFISYVLPFFLFFLFFLQISVHLISPAKYSIISNTAILIWEGKMSESVKKPCLSTLHCNAGQLKLQSCPRRDHRPRIP